MAVIGYDGRLRPASTGAMQNPESQFNADRVGRVAAAQPKFSEDVAKLLNDGGQKLVNYGSKVAQQGQELEDLKDAESIQAEKRQIAEEGRKIREDKTMTPDEKAARGEGLSGRYPSEAKVEEGASHRDQMRTRRRAMTLGEAAWQESYRIQQEADRMREASETAKFGAEATIADANFGVWADENFPKMHAKGVKPEDARESLEKAFDEQNKDFVAGMNEGQKAEWEKIRGRVLAGSLLRYGKFYNEQTRSKAVSDVNVYLSGITAGAKSAKEAGDAAREALKNPLVSDVMTDVQKASTVNGVMIGNSVNAVSEASSSINLARAQFRQEGAKLLTDNKLEDFKKREEEHQKFIDATYSSLEKRLSDDEKEVIARIDGDKNLSEPVKKGMKEQTRKKYRELRDKVALDKASDTAVLKSASAGVKREVGKSAWDSTKDLVRGKTDTAPNDFVKKLNLKLLCDEGTLNELSGITKDGEGKNESGYDFKAVGSIVLGSRYPGMDPEEAKRHFEYDAMMMIARLDVSSPDGGNAIALNDILDAVGQTLGYKSSSYARIASFARKNLIQEKNGNPDAVRRWEKDIFGEKDKSWDGWSPEMKDTYVNVMTLLKETPLEDLATTGKSIKDFVLSQRLFSEALMSRGSLNTAVAEAQDVAKLAKEGKKEASDKKSDKDFESGFSNLEDEARIAGNEAELEALTKYGANRRESARARRNAEGWYWYEKAKALGIKLSSDIKKGDDITPYGVESLRDKVRYRILSENETRRKKEKRVELENKLKALGLPMNRREYTSFLGIGGYPVNEFDEIELGNNMYLFGRDDLTMYEMEEILRQYEYYKGVQSGREMEASARREELENEIKKLKEKKRGA